MHPVHTLALHPEIHKHLRKNQQHVDLYSPHTCRGSKKQTMYLIQSSETHHNLILLNFWTSNIQTFRYRHDQKIKSQHQQKSTILPSHQSQSFNKSTNHLGLLFDDSTVEENEAEKSPSLPAKTEIWQRFASYPSGQRGSRPCRLRRSGLLGGWISQVSVSSESPLFISHGKAGPTNPGLGDLLTRVINHLLSGMILQVPLDSQV